VKHPSATSDKPANVDNGTDEGGVVATFGTAAGHGLAVPAGAVAS
jgi:hypothetical protein